AVALGARRAHARHRLRVAVARLAVLHVALHGWSFGAASTSSGCTDANCVCRVTLRPHFWHLAYFADVTRVAPPHSGHNAPIAIRIDVNTPRCLRFASVKRSLRVIACPLHTGHLCGPIALSLRLCVRCHRSVDRSAESWSVEGGFRRVGAYPPARVGFVINGRALVQLTARLLQSVRPPRIRLARLRRRAGGGECSA